VRRAGSFLVVSLAALALAGCGSGGGSPAGASGKRISRSDYGTEWPLTVEEGTLSCSGPGAVTFTTDDGTTYWVNGTAGGMADEKGWLDIKPIWAKNPNPIYGPRKSIGPLIDDGLKFCH
jgi:hypothetical protein